MIYLEKVHLLNAAVQHFEAVRNEIGERRRRLTQNLNNLIAARASKSEIAVLESRAKDVEAEFTGAFDAWEAATKLRASCYTWAHQQGKNPQDEYEPPRPHLAPAAGGRAVEQIKQLQAVREKIEAQLAEHAGTKSAPPPAKDLIAQKQMAVDAALDEVCNPKARLVDVDPTVLLVAIHADALRKIITGHIEKTIGKNGITPADKSARLAEIDATLLELEREEEQICLAIEAAGEYVSRREMFPPAIFFEIPAEDITGNEISMAASN
jgi:hypothetical protein